MPQYLLSVHHGDNDALPEGVDPQEVFTAVDAFNSRLQQSGQMVFAGGLMPASSATVVNSDGSTTSGPRIKGEEYMGGFWVVEAADDEAALELGRQAVQTRCGRTIEVRPFQSA